MECGVPQPAPRFPFRRQSEHALGKLANAKSCCSYSFRLVHAQERSLRPTSKLTRFIVLFAFVAVISGHPAEFKPMIFTEGNFIVGAEPYPVDVLSFR